MADDIVVRPAEVDEQSELQALQLRAAMADEEYRLAIEKHRWAMQLPSELIRRGHVMVAELHGSIVGVATMLPRGKDIELEGIFVEPSSWRKGVGRELVASCAARARETDARALVVLSRLGIEQFYLACGFETLGVDDKGAEPGLRMRMALSAGE